jgi:hypothetical protein
MSSYKFGKVETCGDLSRKAVRYMERLLIEGRSVFFPILINYYVLILCSYIDLHPIIHVLCGNKPREVVRGKIHDWTMSLRELRLCPAQFCFYTSIVKASITFADGDLFPRLNKLALHFAPSRFSDSFARRMKIVAMAVDYINETLRVPAKLEEILVGPVYEDIKGKSCLLDTDVYFWQPPARKTFATWALEMSEIPRKRGSIGKDTVVVTSVNRINCDDAAT